LYIATLGMMACSLPLHADSLTVEGDLNVEGNLGVGTPTPSEKLEVDGNVKVNGSVISTGTITAPSITLPNGTLTSAKATTLYNAAGQPVATVGADGKVNFTNGLSVGSDPAATITPNSVAHLNQTLANLGFRENPVTATPINSLPITGQVTFVDIARAGNFVYVVGSGLAGATIGGEILEGPGDQDIAFVAKVAVNGVAEWVSPVSGTSSISVASVAVDSSGGVLVVGNFYDTTTSLGGANVTSAGSDDGLIIKFDSIGVVQWAKAVGGLGSDGLVSVAVDSVGNVLVGGRFDGAIVNLGGAANVSSAGGSDGLIAKFNAAGAVQWAKAFGSTNFDSAYSVACDNAGDVIAVGAFYGTISNLGGAANVSSAGGSDGLVVKFNASGAVQWAKAVGSTSNQALSSVATDGAGNIIASGGFSGTIANLGGAANVSSAGAFDGLIVKFNSTGVIQWAKAVGGSDSDNIQSLACDAAGNIIAGAYFAGTIANLGGGANVSSVGNLDGLIVKLGAGGNVIDVSRIGGADNDFIRSISTTGSEVWFVGNVSNTYGNYDVWPVGDRHVIDGSFALGTTTLPIITPSVGGAVPLAWGSSIAENSGIALGNDAYASGDGSAALGRSTAIASNAFSAGSGIAQGFGSVALGWSTKATGQGSVAMGTYTKANGFDSFAVGYNNEAIGNGSVVLGGESRAFGVGSIAIGSQSVARGNYSIALGHVVEAQAIDSLVVGRMNIGQGSSTEWVATDDLFVIGNGSNDWDSWSPSNAFVVHKNGTTRTAGTVESKKGFRTPPMGDLDMGTFTAGPTPAGPSATGNNPADLSAGLRYSGE
jgi:hypothetical protein